MERDGEGVSPPAVRGLLCLVYFFSIPELTHFKTSRVIEH